VNGQDWGSCLYTMTANALFNSRGDTDPLCLSLHEEAAFDASQIYRFAGKALAVLCERDVCFVCIMDDLDIPGPKVLA
jgi:hypothetical protein